MTHAASSTRIVRLAPDWLPNTNHIGFYVAASLGYYDEEGLRLELLPFDGEAMPNRKIVTGETEFGLMPHQSIISMRARGMRVLSVAALVQANTTTLAVRADSGIIRPAELAQRRYASFGTEFEVPMLDAIIRHDGGHAGPQIVSAEKLDILNALLDGEIDIAWGFFAWEGLQSELAGHSLRHFFVAQHGIPAEYFPLLFTTQALAETEPELVRAVVRATARGYQFAIADPDAAASLFLRDVPAGDLPPRAESLVRRSLEWLAPRLAGDLEGVPDPRGWGWHDPARWAAFASFIRALAQRHGLTQPEAGAETAGFTNDFLPGAL